MDQSRRPGEREGKCGWAFNPTLTLMPGESWLHLRTQSLGEKTKVLQQKTTEITKNENNYYPSQGTK
jgi:hypothetical protein